jgi:replicative DNA helicase
VKLKFIGKYTKFADFDAPVTAENPFSGMITRESRLNQFKEGDSSTPPPPPTDEDDMPF